MSISKANEIMRRTAAHDGCNLWSIYKTCSYQKEQAYNYCREMAYKLNMTYWGVLGGNSCTFSFGGYGYINNKLVVIYITHVNNFIYIED